MVQIQINTTQNVTINFTAASVGERILAYIIDMVIKIAYAVVIYQVVFKYLNIYDLTDGMDYWSEMSIYVIFYMPAIFYTLILESWLDGQTLGKRILRIRVVKIDGYQASLSDFVMRWFFRLIDLNIMGGLIALITVITSPKNQRLGDMSAGTSVISLKNNINMSHTILEDLKDNYIPSFATVIKLSDNDARIIKDTFLAAKKVNDYDTLIKLRTKIMNVAEIKDRKTNSDIEFISTILKDYNYYTQDMKS